MGNSFDAIVIGAGAMGTAATWALARRRQRVLCLDQFGVSNTMGSSHGHTRITRMAYFEHPDYVPLLRRSNELWSELESTRGELLLRTGGLYVGPPDCPLITGSKESADLHRLEHEILTRDEIGYRYPQFALPEDAIGFFEADGGVLFPERCIAAMVSAAGRLGAKFHGHESVLSWEGQGSTFSVKTRAGTYEAERLILCAGPWAPKLLSGIGVELQVTRQTAGWFWPRNPDDFQPDRFPICALQDDRGSFTYAFPMFADKPGLKAASHDLGPVVLPDAPRREPCLADTDPFLPTLKAYVPDSAETLLSLSACLYTNSPDGHFILDRLPGQQNVAFGCGFSGHGFKFATVVGETLADLVTDGQTKLPIEFLRLSRFQR